MSRKNQKRQKKFLIIASPYSWGGGIKSMIDETIKSLKIINYNYLLVIPKFAANNTNLLEKNYKEINTLKFINFDKFPLIHHVIFALKSMKYLKGFDKYFAVVATSHTALPFVFSKKPFSLWVATSYADELESKYNSLMGDKPARKLRNSFHWKILASIERLVYQKATKIFALSDYTATKIKEIDQGLSYKIDILNFPIDTLKFRPFENKKANNTLIFTGRINDPRKNVILLLHILKKLREKIPDIKLVLVGDNPNILVRETAKKLKIVNNVEFIPAVPRDEIPKLLNKANLFVCTSTQEGLGISILEALSCCLPVVTIACGGPESIVIKSGAGYVCNSTSIMRNKINQLLSNPKKIERLGRKGQKYIKENFSYQQFINKIQ